jgi:hypothetical protein
MIADPVARLFWEMNPEKLDSARDRNVIIPRVLNYGSLADWRWLEQQYGREALRAEVLAGDHSNIRERSRRLAGLLFA